MTEITFQGAFTFDAACLEGLIPSAPAPQPVQSAAKPVLLGSGVWWSGNIGITDGNSELWYAVRRIALVNVKAGDIFDIRAQFAVRNDTGWNVEFATAVAYVTGAANPPGYYSNSTFGGVRVGAVNGDNITPGQHYGSPVKVEEFQAPADADAASILAIVRARCSAANGNQILTQLNDQQKLTALKFGGAP